MLTDILPTIPDQLGHTQTELTSYLNNEDLRPERGLQYQKAYDFCEHVLTDDRIVGNIYDYFSGYDDSIVTKTLFKGSTQFVSGGAAITLFGVRVGAGVDRTHSSSMGFSIGRIRDNGLNKRILCGIDFSVDTGIGAGVDAGFDSEGFGLSLGVSFGRGIVIGSTWDRWESADDFPGSYITKIYEANVGVSGDLSAAMAELDVSSNINGYVAQILSFDGKYLGRMTGLELELAAEVQLNVMPSPPGAGVSVGVGGGYSTGHGVTWDFKINHNDIVDDEIEHSSTAIEYMGSTEIDAEPVVKIYKGKNGAGKEIDENQWCNNRHYKTFLFHRKFSIFSGFYTWHRYNCAECPKGHVYNDLDVWTSKDSKKWKCSSTSRTRSIKNTCCTACPRGKYINRAQEPDYGHVTTCKTCPVGRYNGQNGQGECKKCPVGKFLEYTGSTSLTQCKSCPAGRYQHQSGQSECKKCRDRWQDETGQTRCHQCPTGKFGDGVGLKTRADACKDCPIGFASTSNTGNNTYGKVVPYYSDSIGTISTWESNTEITNNYCLPCDEYQDLSDRQISKKCFSGRQNFMSGEISTWRYYDEDNCKIPRKNVYNSLSLMECMTDYTVFAHDEYSYFGAESYIGDNACLGKPDRWLTLKAVTDVNELYTKIWIDPRSPPLDGKTYIPDQLVPTLPYENNNTYYWVPYKSYGGRCMLNDVDLNLTRWQCNTIRWWPEQSACLWGQGFIKQPSINSWENGDDRVIKSNNRHLTETECKSTEWKKGHPSDSFFIDNGVKDGRIRLQKRTPIQMRDYYDEPILDIFRHYQDEQGQHTCKLCPSGYKVNPNNSAKCEKMDIPNNMVSLGDMYYSSSCPHNMKPSEDQLSCESCPQGKASRAFYNNNKINTIDRINEAILEPCTCQQCNTTTHFSINSLEYGGCEANYIDHDSPVKQIVLTRISVHPYQHTDDTVFKTRSKMKRIGSPTHSGHWEVEDDFTPEINLKCFSEDQGYAAPAIYCKNDDCTEYELLIGTINNIAMFKKINHVWKRLANQRHWSIFLKDDGNYAKYWLEDYEYMVDLWSATNKNWKDYMSDFWYDQLYDAAKKYCMQDTEMSPVKSIFLAPKDYNGNIMCPNKDETACFHEVAVRPTVLGSHMLINSPTGIKYFSLKNTYVDLYPYKNSAGMDTGGPNGGWLPNVPLKKTEKIQMVDGRRKYVTNYLDQSTCYPSLTHFDDNTSPDLFLSCEGKIYFFADIFTDQWKKYSRNLHSGVKTIFNVKTANELEKYRIADWKEYECWEQYNIDSTTFNKYKRIKDVKTYDQCENSGVCKFNPNVYGTNASLARPVRLDIQDIIRQYQVETSKLNYYTYAHNSKDCTDKGAIWEPFEYTWVVLSDNAQCVDSDYQPVAFSTKNSCLGAGICKPDVSKFDANSYHDERSCENAALHLSEELLSQNFYTHSDFTHTNVPNDLMFPANKPYIFRWYPNLPVENSHPLEQQSLGLSFLDIDNDGDKDMFATTDQKIMFFENEGLQRALEKCKWTHAKCIYNTVHRSGVTEFDCTECAVEPEKCSLEYLMFAMKDCRNRPGECYKLGGPSYDRAPGQDYVELAGYCSSLPGGTGDPDDPVLSSSDKVNDIFFMDAYHCTEEQKAYYVPYKYSTTIPGIELERNKPRFTNGTCSCTDNDEAITDYTTCVNRPDYSSSNIVWNMFDTNQLPKRNGKPVNFRLKDGTIRTLTQLSIESPSITFDPEGGMYIGDKNGDIHYYYLKLISDSSDGGEITVWQEWEASSGLPNVFSPKTYNSNTCYEKEVDIVDFCNGVRYKNSEHSETQCCRYKKGSELQYLYYPPTDVNNEAKCCVRKESDSVEGNSDNCCPKKGQIYNVDTGKCDCSAQHGYLKSDEFGCCKLKNTYNEIFDRTHCCPSHGEIYNLITQTCECSSQVVKLNGKCCKPKDYPHSGIDDNTCCRNVGQVYVSEGKCKCGEGWIATAGVHPCKKINTGIHEWHGSIHEWPGSKQKYWPYIPKIYFGCTAFGKMNRDNNNINKCKCDSANNFISLKRINPWVKNAQITSLSVRRLPEYTEYMDNYGACCLMKTDSTSLEPFNSQYYTSGTANYCCPTRGEILNRKLNMCHCSATDGYLNAPFYTEDETIAVNNCWECPFDTFKEGNTQLGTVGDSFSQNDLKCLYVHNSSAPIEEYSVVCPQHNYLDDFKPVQREDGLWYKTGGTCKPCPHGHDNSYKTTDFWIGGTQNKPISDGDKYSTECQPCAKDYYTEYRGQQCSVCEPGTGRPFNSQNTCQTCTAGKFNDESHGEQIELTYYTGEKKQDPNIARELLDSWDDWYKPSSMRHYTWFDEPAEDISTPQCLWCPPGKYSDSGASECIKCSPGMYSSFKTSGQCLSLSEQVVNNTLDSDELVMAYTKSRKLPYNIYGYKESYHIEILNLTERIGCRPNTFCYATDSECQSLQAPYMTNWKDWIRNCNHAGYFGDGCDDNYIQLTEKYCRNCPLGRTKTVYGNTKPMEDACQACPSGKIATYSGCKFCPLETPITSEYSPKLFINREVDINNEAIPQASPRMAVRNIDGNINIIVGTQNGLLVRYIKQADKFVEFDGTFISESDNWPDDFAYKTILVLNDTVPLGVIHTYPNGTAIGQNEYFKNARIQTLYNEPDDIPKNAVQKTYFSIGKRASPAFNGSHLFVGTENDIHIFDYQHENDTFMYRNKLARPRLYCYGILPYTFIFHNPALTFIDENKDGYEDMMIIGEEGYTSSSGQVWLVRDLNTMCPERLIEGLKPTIPFRGFDNTLNHNSVVPSAAWINDELRLYLGIADEIRVYKITLSTPPTLESISGTATYNKPPRRNCALTEQDCTQRNTEGLCYWFNSCVDSIYVQNNVDFMNSVGIEPEICGNNEDYDCSNITSGKQCKIEWKGCISQDDCITKNGYSTEDEYQTAIEGFRANCKDSCNLCPRADGFNLYETYLNPRLNMFAPVLFDIDNDGYKDMMISFNRERVTTGFSHFNGIEFLIGMRNWEHVFSDGNFKFLKGNEFANFTEIEPQQDPLTQIRSNTGNPMYGIDLADYVMEYSQTKRCLACPSGTFANETGLTNSSECQTCPFGSQLNVFNTMSNGIEIVGGMNCLECDFETQYYEYGECRNFECQRGESLVEDKACYNYSNVRLVEYINEVSCIELGTCSQGEFKNKSACEYNNNTWIHENSWSFVWEKETPNTQKNTKKCRYCFAGTFENDGICTQCAPGKYSEVVDVQNEDEQFYWSTNIYPSLYGLYGQNSNNINETEIRAKINEWNVSGNVRIYLPKVNYMIVRNITYNISGNIIGNIAFKTIKEVNHSVTFDIQDISSVGGHLGYKRQVCIDRVGFIDPEDNTNTFYKEDTSATIQGCTLLGSCVIPSKSLETPSHNSAWGCTNPKYTDNTTCINAGWCEIDVDTTKESCETSNDRMFSEFTKTCYDDSFTKESCENQYGYNKWSPHVWKQGISADIHVNNFQNTCNNENFEWRRDSYYTGMCLDNAFTSENDCNNENDRKWISHTLDSLESRLQRPLVIRRHGGITKKGPTTCEQCPQDKPLSSDGITCESCSQGFAYINGSCSKCTLGYVAQQSQCESCPMGRYHEMQKTSGWTKTCVGKSYFENDKCHFNPIQTLVGEPKNGSTTYYKITEGSCSGIYEPINNNIECQQAAEQLNLGANEQTWKNSQTKKPSGCIHHTYKINTYPGAWFNPKTVFSDDTQCSETWNCICKRSNWEETMKDNGEINCPSIDECSECRHNFVYLALNCTQFQDKINKNVIPHNILTFFMASIDDASKIDQGVATVNCSTYDNIKKTHPDYTMYVFLDSSCTSVTPWNNMLAGDVCNECPNGYYQTEDAKTECKECPLAANYKNEMTIPALNSVCNDCEAGRFIDRVTNGYVCNKCTHGKYQDEHGKTSCKQCPAGRQVNNVSTIILVKSSNVFTLNNSKNEFTPQAGDTDQVYVNSIMGEMTQDNFTIDNIAYDTGGNVYGVMAYKNEFVVYDNTNRKHVQNVVGSTSCSMCPPGKYKSEDMDYCETCDGDAEPTEDQKDCFCGDEEDTNWHLDIQWNKEKTSYREDCIKCDPDGQNGFCKYNSTTGESTAHCGAIIDHRGRCHDCLDGPVCVDNYAYCNTTNYDCLGERDVWSHPTVCAEKCDFMPEINCSAFTHSCNHCDINIVNNSINIPCRKDGSLPPKPPWIKDNMTLSEQKSVSYQNLKDKQCLIDCGALTYTCPVYNCTLGQDCCHNCAPANNEHQYNYIGSKIYREFMKNDCNPYEAPWLRNCSDYTSSTECNENSDICKWEVPHIDTTPWANSCASECIRYRTVGDLTSEDYLNNPKTICTCPDTLDECYHYCGAEWKTYIRNGCEPSLAPDELKNDPEYSICLGIEKGQLWENPKQFGFKDDAEDGDYCIGDCEVLNLETTCYRWEYNIPERRITGWYPGVDCGSSEWVSIEGYYYKKCPSEEGNEEIDDKCPGYSDCILKKIKYYPAAGSHVNRTWCTAQNGTFFAASDYPNYDPSNDFNFDQCMIPIVVPDGETCVSMNGTDLSDAIQPEMCVNKGDTCYDDCDAVWKYWIDTEEILESGSHHSNALVNGNQVKRLYKRRCGGFPPFNRNPTRGTDFGCEAESLKADNGKCSAAWTMPSTWDGEAGDYCLGNCPRAEDNEYCVPANHRCFTKQNDDKYPCTTAWQNWANNNCSGAPPWDETTDENTKYGCPRIEIDGLERRHPADDGECEKPTPWVGSCASECKFKKMGCPVFSPGWDATACWSNKCNASKPEDKKYIDYIGESCPTLSGTQEESPWYNVTVVDNTYWPDPEDSNSNDNSNAQVHSCVTKKMQYRISSVDNLDIYKRYLTANVDIVELSYDVPLQTRNITERSCLNNYYINNSSRWQQGDCQWSSKGTCVNNEVGSECFSGSNCNDLYYYELLGPTRKYYKATSGQCWPTGQKCNFMTNTLSYFDIDDEKLGQECVPMDCNQALDIYNYQCTDDDSSTVCQDALSYFNQNCNTC